MNSSSTFRGGPTLRTGENSQVARSWSVAVQVVFLLGSSGAAGCGNVSRAAPAPGSAAGSGAGSDDARTAEALDDALSERRVFRHVLVGAVINPPRRYTWVLLRRAKRARLAVYCQDGKAVSRAKSPHPGISLTGDENDDSLWLAPGHAAYVGVRVADTPLAYELSGPPGCGLPGTLRVTCRPDKVDVRPAGAALVPGGKRADDTMRPARWEPPVRKPVDVLRCDVAIAGDPDLGHLDLKHWPLAFASPRAIEWAWENSDMIVQEGAYRWLPD